MYGREALLRRTMVYGREGLLRHRTLVYGLKG